MGGTISNQISEVLMFAICYFEFLIAYQFFQSYLKEKRNGRQSFVFCVLASTILTVINVIWPQSVITTISITILLYIYVRLFFEGKFKQYIYGIVIIVITGVISEGIALLINMYLLGNDFDKEQIKTSYLLFVGTVSKTIWYMNMRVFIHARIKSKYNYVSHSLNSVLIFPVVNMISMYSMVMTTIENTTTAHLVLISGIGVLGLASCIFIVKIYENSLDRSELDYQLRVSQVEKSYFESIKQNEQILKQRQHEYKNSLLNIRGLVEEKEYDKATGFINELVHYLGKEKDLALTTDFSNKIVNVAINSNRLICDENKIELEVKIEYLNLAFIHPIDTSIMLNNAFNNAIDGCMTVPATEPRFIRLRIYRLHDELIIGMINSKRNKIIMGDDGPISTKDVTINHGNGYKNMIECAKRYGGNIAFQDKGEMFTLQIRLKCE